MSRSVEVFAIGRGQYENIGDIVLRRRLLDWVRPEGGLQVYVGDSPDGYDEGLRLHPHDTVHRSLSAWYRAALGAALRGRGAYVFKPGELQLTLIGMKEHLVMLPLLAALRLRGGASVRAGVGARNFARLPRLLMRPSIALSDLTLWRDHRSAAYMRGDVMPDLAFGEGSADADVERWAASDAGRDKLVVSMRADEDVHPCPYPTAEWIEAVRAFAARHALAIHVVTQVQVDDERTVRLAADLGGTALRWPEVADHAAQEERLRELYRSTAIALSDRLHVIITAMTEGAVPVGSMVDGTDKVERHFATIGVHGVALRTGTMSAPQIVDALDGLLGRREEILRALLDARAELRTAERRVRDALGLRAAPAVRTAVEA